MPHITDYEQVGAFPFDELHNRGHSMAGNDMRRQLHSQRLRLPIGVCDDAFEEVIGVSLLLDDLGNGGRELGKLLDRDHVQLSVVSLGKMDGSQYGAGGSCRTVAGYDYFPKHWIAPGSRLFPHRVA
jgi:hypothetical protein